MCPYNYSKINIEENVKTSELTAKDFYSSWQTAVMKQLRDFASITNLVVDPKTSEFLANQEGVMKRQNIARIRQELFSGSSKFSFIFLRNKLQ